MKPFVREEAATAMVILVVTVAVTALTGGGAGAVYLTMFVCLAAVGWRDKRKESRP